MRVPLSRHLTPSPSSVVQSCASKGPPHRTSMATRVECPRTVVKTKVGKSPWLREGDSGGVGLSWSPGLTEWVSGTIERTRDSISLVVPRHRTWTTTSENPGGFNCCGPIDLDLLLSVHKTPRTTLVRTVSSGPAGTFLSLRGVQSRSKVYAPRPCTTLSGKFHFLFNNMEHGEW